MKSPKCKTCGKEITRRQHGKEDKMMYCSRKCSYADIENWPNHTRHRDSTKYCRVYFVKCPVCGKLYSKRVAYGKPNGCSVSCQSAFLRWQAKEYYRIRHKRIGFRCKWCGKNVEPKDGSKLRDFCSTRCMKRFGTYHYKIKKLETTKDSMEKFSPLKIFMRDGWKCQICGGKINREVKAPHPMSGSIDHIIPLAKGGQHTKANVRCAHFICNSRKGVKISAYGDQLRLI